MARSKEQWKAQQRALHTQTQSKSFFQMKRPGPHPPGTRPTAPPASFALFQLGRPTTVRPAVLQSDPIQTPSVSGRSSGQAIDLTLDDDDEDEDEPMGAQQPVTAATASDAVKLSMLDGTRDDAAVMVQSLQLTDSMSDVMVPLVEEVESDVDEDWPAVPPSTASSMLSPITSWTPPTVNVRLSQSASSPTPLPMNEQATHNQTKEDVGAALDAIRKTIPFSRDGQEGSVLERNIHVEPTRQQTSTPPLYGDDDDEMELDVDEELPKQAPTAENGAAGSPTTTDRIVQAENLEDGEIFEEGAAPKPTLQVQHAMMRNNPTGQCDAHLVDAKGVRPHLRNKKQKKRGKKKTKRKLEAMQMMYAPPGEMVSEFERTTRQQPYSDAPPPGQYTLAMMRNGPRGDPMNVRPLFQDPPPVPFRSGALVVGSPMIPPPQQLQPPPLPRPPPYGDSQILRVNRQGNMEMLDELPRHLMFVEPPMQGGFKYRSVSMSPCRPMPGGSSQSPQRSLSDQSRLPPIPPPSRGGITTSDPSRESDDSDDFDLDSLRVAALRSKVKRPLKTSTSTPATPSVTEMPSSTSSSSSSFSPRPTHNEEVHSEPVNYESENELRLKILRSMMRNRKRTVTKAQSNVRVLTPPVSETIAVGVSSQNSDSAKSADENGECASANEKSPEAQTCSNVAESSQPTLLTACDTAQAKRIVNDGTSCDTDKFTITSEQTDVGDKTESPATCVSVPAMPSAEPAVTTPEFRPLTACSQSIVIRLCPEDFSPHKSRDDLRPKSTASSSLQDAIKEMRRKIAEREKEQTNRLLENAAARLSMQSSGSRSTSNPTSSSSTPHQLSPGEKVSTVIARSPGASAIYPEVSPSAIENAKEQATGVPAVESEAKSAIDCIGAQAIISEGKEIIQASPSETLIPAEAATRRESLEKPKLKFQEHGDTPGVSTFADMHILPPVLQHQVPVSSDGRNGDPASEPCVKKSIEPVAAA
ncbi:hypothetical protein PHYPSEUDO_011719 [Phytophthora pseudosyringae]|uniref:Uncharacterized protein n=1 Tax=Phytophthora pseudosyringae TaxID=221518 RepID=A0A8T1W6A4_9STRA|nr:hypothetical protein PHYPSEUDO_011719 [Phytophthora pseudosyringae]